MTWVSLLKSIFAQKYRFYCHLLSYWNIWSMNLIGAHCARYIFGAQIEYIENIVKQVDIIVFILFPPFVSVICNILFSMSCTRARQISIFSSSLRSLFPNNVWQVAVSIWYATHLYTHTIARIHNTTRFLLYIPIYNSISRHDIDFSHSHIK